MKTLRALARSLSPGRPAPQELAEVTAALRCLGWPPADEPAAEEPVFVLATGWRSGSTLLQRILCTDGRLLLWGEPFGRMARPDEPLPLSWIANLFPSAAASRAGLRALFEEWLARPARERGFTRWGLRRDRVELGLRHLLEAGVVEAKRPRFDHSPEFDSSVFGLRFDLFLARSIWTHAAKPQIRDQCQRRGLTVAPLGRFEFGGQAWLSIQRACSTSTCR